MYGRDNQLGRMITARINEQRVRLLAIGFANAITILRTVASITVDRMLRQILG